MAYSFAQLEQLWISNGGNPATAPVMAAVAMAESGGNPSAVSPSNDYGLWQINESNFASYGLNSSNWSDPNTNAKVAIKMSGNGSNIAAWCTAWAQPKGNCGHGQLSAPQAGSPAYKNLASYGGGSAASYVASSNAAKNRPTDCDDQKGGIPLPGTGARIFNECQTRAMLGGLLMGVGVLGTLLGVGLILAAGTGSRKLLTAVQAAPGPVGRSARVVGSIGSGRAPTRTQRQRERPSQSDEDRRELAQRRANDRGMQRAQGRRNRRQEEAEKERERREGFEGAAA